MGWRLYLDRVHVHLGRPRFVPLFGHFHPNNQDQHSHSTDRSGRSMGRRMADQRKTPGPMPTLLVPSLNQAGVPLDLILDRVPARDSGWVYVADEWSNNTWTSQCTTSSLPSVAFHMLDGGSIVNFNSMFQPSWFNQTVLPATAIGPVESNIGFCGPSQNFPGLNTSSGVTGACRDMMSFALWGGSAPTPIGTGLVNPWVKISIIAYLLPLVPLRGETPAETYFVSVRDLHHQLKPGHFLTPSPSKRT